MNLADALHQACMQYGQPVTIKRRTGTQQVITSQVETFATIRPRSGQDMPAGTTQGGWLVIVSPVDIYRALGNGLRRRDVIAFDGRDHTIEAVNEISAAGAVVRIELDVIG